MTGRMDDLQKLVNRQAQSITGMLKSTPAGPLVKEAGLRPAKSLLSNRHRRYATRAYGLPLGHPIGDGIRNPSIDKSIFGNLSKTAKDGVDICHSGQDVIEYTWMPACIERIDVPLIIESRDKAERSAATSEEESTRCIWTDGSRDELGSVGAAAVWMQGNQWAGLKFRLGRNKEVFDAELYGLLQATVTVRDEAARWISSGISKVIILSDSQAALHRIGHNGIGPGQMWAMAIIENTRIISQSGIKLEYRWVPGHSGIDGNETADAYAKDAAIPENEEALPSQVDRFTSLSHISRKTTEKKWKQANEWFHLKCRSNKYYRLNENHKPNMMIARTEKSTSQIIYQMTTGHALIGSHLKRVQKIESDVCWWCQCGATQTREHLFKCCRRWKGQHKVLWKSVREASGRLMTST
jgi:ribonuclease HI